MRGARPARPGGIRVTGLPRARAESLAPAPAPRVEKLAHSGNSSRKISRAARSLSGQASCSLCQIGWNSPRCRTSRRQYPRGDAGRQGRPRQCAGGSQICTEAARYLEFDALADRLAALAAGLFTEHDLLVTLSTPGDATRLEEGPRSGVMSMPWSLCGLPTLSLPLLRGAQGLPIGVQLIGPRGKDRFLLQAGSWLVAAAGPVTSPEA